MRWASTIGSFLLAMGLAADAAAGVGAAAAAEGEPGLALSEPVSELGQLAREPMLVQHPEGTLFVAGYGSQAREQSHPRQVPLLWRSDDGGASWRRVDVGTAEEGAVGNSDVDLAVGPEGTLYFASMGFDRTTFRGTHVALGASRDGGATWTWTLLSETDLDDRPWVVAAPDGVAHVIWNDGEGVAYARSEDRGATWTERPRISSRGGSSHLAVGPGGELAARIGPMSASGHRFHDGADWIALSTDGGDTWTLRRPPGSAVWPRSFADLEAAPRWVEPLAFDAAGALYHLWGEGGDARLARSSDLGVTWTTWTLAGDRGVVFFPYLTARRSGELAATWFERSADGDLRARVARIRIGPGTDAAPEILESEPLALDVWNVRADPPVRDTGGEYFPALLLESGELAVVTTIQDPQRDRWGFDWWTAPPP